VALFAVVVALLLVFLNWYIGPTKPSDKKELVLALAQILAGTALLSGLYFTWRTLQVNREGQITDRFTRAIDQLGKTDDEGNKLLEIRLGGIYALERIARESAEDHWPIMEVLTAYVRQHAPRRPEEAQKGTEDAAEAKSAMEDSGGTSETTEGPPDPDIQAIMTVLRRRTRSFGHGEPEPIDLHETHLTGADLFHTNFTRAILYNANLSGADLSGANLSRTNLYGANLSGTNLYGADLSEAILSEATLTGAYLQGANLSGAILYNANLSGAHLSEANLTVANLSGANLSGAGLWRANLAAANVVEADLSGAYLQGANLRGAILTQEQLEEATGDENTKLPPHLKPPAHWGVKTDEQIERD
jgi:uncharacterized protein YjbI with pentapeptide repeats